MEGGEGGPTVKRRGALALYQCQPTPTCAGRDSLFPSDDTACCCQPKDKYRGRKKRKNQFFKNSTPRRKVEISVGSGHEEPSAGLCDSRPDQKGALEQLWPFAQRSVRFSKAREKTLKRGLNETAVAQNTQKRQFVTSQRISVAKGQYSWNPGLLNLE